MTRETIDHIKGSLYDENQSTGANLAHMQHVFEAYRDFIMEGIEDGNPYSPGSARDRSYKIGLRIAKNDMDNRGPLTQIDSRTVLIRVLAQVGAGKSVIAHLIKDALVKAGLPEVMIEDLDGPIPSDQVERRINGLSERGTKIHIRTVALRRGLRQRNGSGSQGTTS